MSCVAILKQSKASSLHSAGRLLHGTSPSGTTVKHQLAKLLYKTQSKVIAVFAVCYLDGQVKRWQFVGVQTGHQYCMRCTAMFDHSLVQSR